MAAGLAGQSLRSRYLYLLAGTPATEGWPGGRAALYARGAQGEPELLRIIFTSRQGGLYDVRDDMHGLLYVRCLCNELSVIHESAPSDTDVVSFPRNFEEGDDQCWGVSAGLGQKSTALFCHAPGAGIPGGLASLVVRVLGSRAAPSRVTPGAWGAYADFQYGGSFGGPGMLSNQLLPGGVSIRGRSAFIWLSYWHVPARLCNFAGAIPAGVVKFAGGGMVADSSRFLVIWSVPAILTQRAPYAGPTSVYVYDKENARWQIYTPPTDVTLSSRNTAARLLGDWLAVDEVRYRPPGSPSPRKPPHPATPNETSVGATAQPSTNPARDAAVRQAIRGESLYAPGRFLLLNLADGRRVSLITGQPDSEVLAIRKDGLVLYRVNDAIYRTHINGEKLGPATLVVKGPVVPQIHWVFWSSAKPKGGS